MIKQRLKQLAKALKVIVGKLPAMTKREVVSCDTEREQSRLGKGWVWGVVLSVVVLEGGCTEWTIPPCAEKTFKTPCVGPCTVAVEPVGPTYTRATVPLAVVIQDERGTLHCQQIQP